MAHTLQGTLFDDLLTFEETKEIVDVPISFRPPLSCIPSSLVSSFSQILAEFQNGKSADFCVTKLTETEKIPYDLAAFLILTEAFPVVSSK